MEIHFLFSIQCFGFLQQRNFIFLFFHSTKTKWKYIEKAEEEEEMMNFLSRNFHLFDYFYFRTSRRSSRSGIIQKQKVE